MVDASDDSAPELTRAEEKQVEAFLKALSRKRRGVSADDSAPALTRTEERKVQSILEAVSRKTKGVSAEQEAKLLYHVIEDLFFWRQALLIEDTSSPEEAKQDNARFRHRLQEIVRKVEAEKAGKPPEKRGLLVNMKKDDDDQRPPSMGR